MAARHHVDKARQDMMKEYVKDAQEAESKKQERFDHYYSRYSNHLNSLEVHVHIHYIVLCVLMLHVPVHCAFSHFDFQMELSLLQRSQCKTAELAKLGQVLEKKGE